MKKKDKPKKWSIDNTTKYFLDLIIKDENKKEDSKIIAFRHRWLLGDKGLEDKRLFPNWKIKIKKECQKYRHDIKVSEVEVYFDIGRNFIPQPIFSSSIENRVREEDWGNSLISVFALEIRALGHALKIPSEYDCFLEYLVIYGRKNFKRIFNPGIIISIRYQLNEEYGLLSENICLTLGENTGSEDLDSLWDQRIRPYLKGLEARIKDKKRISKNSNLLQTMVERNAINKNWQVKWKDAATGKQIKEVDRDIAVANKGVNELNRMYRNITPQQEKKLNASLVKPIQNIRYYRSKKNSL